MSVPVVAFFNNKGGVGKTSLLYHLAWTFSDLGVRVLAVDLDPQANLTAAFLDEDGIEKIFPENKPPRTVFGSVLPLISATGDISAPRLEEINDLLALLPGDLSLSEYEDHLSQEWPKCLDRQERAFRVISAFWRIVMKAATKHEAGIVLVDLGPNLGAINRAALIASDYVVVPMLPDLFSIQGLRNLGPALKRWRDEWSERVKKNPKVDLALPKGRMRPVGYVVLQHSERLDRPVKAYDRWIGRIPEVYRKVVLGRTNGKATDVATDRNCLALLKHYRSLMPLAQEARKPMFHLKPADGAIGSHIEAVQAAGKDFRALAEKIARLTGVDLP